MADDHSTNGVPGSPGGSGGPCVLPAGRADTRLIEEALKRGWNIPDKFRRPLLDRQIAIAIDPERSPREQTSAFRSLVAANGQDIDLLHKLIDKLAPDRHEVEHRSDELRSLVAELRADAQHAEFARQIPLGEPDDAGRNGAHRNGRKVDNGPAPEGDR